MIEREIDNHGSKSRVKRSNKITFVKEQRVEGSLMRKLQYIFSAKVFSHLRCILKGFERNYQIRIFPNQINIPSAP
jgi:hypothetical protein